LLALVRAATLQSFLYPYFPRGRLMRCPECGHENAAEMKFCGECGTRLTVLCRECGARNAPSQKFCGDCGARLESGASSRQSPSLDTYTPKHLVEKILTSKTAIEGERKQVTVLFADLKGSMELLADRDPEEARKILDPVIERMMEAVHRYEGTVNQVMGDGIMALFGAPIAHEDHAVRASFAALWMQERVKAFAEEVRRTHAAVIKIRVGLNSGEVVVRAIGSDLHMDYTAVGQTTHLAARMEQIADPGAIVITPDTLALAEGYVEVKPLGPVLVKGLAEPLEIYEVTGAGPTRTRLQVAAGRGLTRFIGRDAELEQLGRAQQLAANGHGQVAAVVGEAGVGKSRLVYEFTHSHRLQDWLVLESASVSYGKATSYLPVIDLLKGYFKIQGRDDVREIREKVTGKLLTLDEALKSTLSPLLALLNLPVDDAAWDTIDPGQRRQRTLEAVKWVLLRETRDKPLLVIFEDLHWIDGETQAVLDTLVESLASSRLLLLVSYRPEYQHIWGSKTFYSQMRLDALPADSAEMFLDALLGDDSGLAPLKQLLVKRGNPFFLEETVRTLAETKALAGERGRYLLTQTLRALQVPPTVQAMLAARIDRLRPEDKHLLQTASAVGKDVPFGLLQIIAELPEQELRRGLDHLQAAEFLYETELYPDLEYAFKHALTHEVTYGGLLQDRRRDLHARIVAAIEALHADRLGEHIERLAHHAFQGNLKEKAVYYLRQAGLKAAARSSVPDSRAWFEQALGVLKGLPESQSTLEQAFEIHLDLRSVLTLLGEPRRMLECLHGAEALATKLNDERRRGRVCALMTNVHSQLGELDEARESGTRALAIALALDDLDLRILATSYLEQAYHYRGEFEQVVDIITNNRTALPADRVYENFGNAASVSVYDRYWLVRSLSELGRFTEATGYAAEAIRLAEPTHHAFTVGLAHFGSGTLHVLKGDWRKARSLLEQGLAVVRTANVVIQLPQTVAFSAWCLAQLGEESEALNRLREGKQLLEHQAARGIVSNHAWAYIALGRTCLLFGRVDEARSLGDRTVESFPSHPGYAAHALHLLGDIATHPDRFDAVRGEAHYRQALALAEPRGMRPLVAHCHLGLGRLSRRTGKRPEAQEHLTAATTMYREMNMRFWLGRAEAEMHELGWR
jgi:class 3 adenylate cyclase/tetratricopeptide (TPR) repeat protein